MARRSKHPPKTHLKEDRHGNVIEVLVDCWCMAEAGWIPKSDFEAKKTWCCGRPKCKELAAENRSVA